MIILVLFSAFILFGCTTTAVCGNDVCEDTENSAICPFDCGYDGADCGDGYCSDAETEDLCSYDCGDGINSALNVTVNSGEYYGECTNTIQDCPNDCYWDCRLNPETATQQCLRLDKKYFYETDASFNAGVGSEKSKLCCDASSTSAEYTNGKPTECCNDPDTALFGTFSNSSLLNDPSYAQGTENASSLCCPAGNELELSDGKPTGCCPTASYLDPRKNLI